MDSDERCRDGRILSVLVVPLSSRTLNRAPTTHVLPAATNGLQVETLALVHLIQPIDRQELAREGVRLGRIDDDQVSILIVKLAWAVGMPGIGPGQSPD